MSSYCRQIDFPWQNVLCCIFYGYSNSILRGTLIHNFCYTGSNSGFDVSILCPQPFNFFIMCSCLFCFRRGFSHSDFVCLSRIESGRRISALLNPCSFSLRWITGSGFHFRLSFFLSVFFFSGDPVDIVMEISVANFDSISEVNMVRLFLPTP